MALCLALSNPDLDVVAVTAVGGNVSPAQSTRNVQAIIEAARSAALAAIGAASERITAWRSTAAVSTATMVWAGANFVVAERQHLLPSEKVICDQIRRWLLMP